MEDEDCYVPAFFQGAPQICFHCRRAGHIRQECQELAKIQCYKCKGYGHMSRYCQNPRNEKSFEDDLETYQKKTATVPATASEKAKMQNTVEENTVEIEQTQDLEPMNTEKPQVEKTDMIQSEEEDVFEMDTEDNSKPAGEQMENGTDSAEKQLMIASDESLRVADMRNEETDVVSIESPPSSPSHRSPKKKVITRQEALKISETVVKRPKIVSRMKPAPTPIRGRIKSASSIAEIRKALHEHKSKDILNE